MKLYELTEQFQEAGRAFNNAENDFEMIEAERYLVAAEVSLTEKAENIARMIKNFESERDMFKKEAARLADKAKSFDNKVLSLKRYLQENLEVAGIDKIKGELFTVALQNNPMSVDINSITHIPSEFKRVPDPVVNKRELLNHIKETGEIFEGVEIVTGRSLRIR